MQQAYAEMFDAEAVGKIFGCSKRTVYRLVKAGRFPKPHKYGKKNLWFAGTVAMWLETLKQESEANVRHKRGRR